jgi:hypothetical protein
MPPKYTAVQLERIRQLLGTPHALEVLEVLSQGSDAVPMSHLPGAPDVALQAVAFLCEFGATRIEGSGPEASVSLTERGRRLAEETARQRGS